MIELIIGLVPLIPVFAGFVIPLIYLLTKSRIAVMSIPVVVFALLTVLTGFVAIEAYSVDHPLVFKAGGWPAPIGIIYIVDKFTAILALVTSIVLLMIGLYSISYIVDDGYPWYTVLLLGNASGMLGVIYTGDLFNLFVMLEVTGVSSYALVMYYRHRADSIVSGLKYAFIGALGTTLYLLAMGLVYGYYDTLNIIDFSYKITQVEGQLYSIVFGIILALALWTFSIKSGVFPNHFWLPDAHPAAPTPISALLSGLVVNTGLVGLYKLLYLASWTANSGTLGAIRLTIAYATIVMGGLSAIIGGLLMLIQRDVKRLIAYSTVMNLGYLFMGIGCLGVEGLQATLFYTITHSLAKATLFMSAGVFIRAAGSRDLESLSGLGTRYKIAGVALATSTLTLAGIPPLPGFLAKLLLYEALFKYNPVLAAVMIIASAIGLLSYMRLFYIIILGVPIIEARRVEFKCAHIALLVLTLVIIALGALTFIPQKLLSVLESISLQSTLGIEKYAEYVKATFLYP